MTQHPLIRISKYAVLVIYSLFSVIPFIWMVSASVKLPGDVLKVPVQWIPPSVHLDNYQHALLDDRFAGASLLDYMINSIVVAAATSLLTIVLSTFVGYGFAKFRFRFRNAMMWGMLSTTLLPFSAVLIPLMLIIRRLGLYDSLWALILPFALTGQGIFLARQFILGVPDDYLDAARVDGAGEIQIFYRIVLPLLGPAIATLGVMAFVTSWTMFLWPLVVISSQDKNTVPFGLALLGLGATFRVDYHLWMAAATLSVLPPLIFFLIFERAYLRGLEALSGLKG